MSSAPLYRRQRGLSLNKLLMVLAIGAGLTAVAVPSYRTYAFSTHRQMVQNLMNEVTDRQQTWAQDHHQFTTLINLGYPGSTIYIGTDGIPQTTASSQSIYAISLATSATNVARCEKLSGPGDGSGYVIVAVPILSQSTDTMCGTLCMDQLGQRGVSGSKPVAACW
jgi:type IV pilus assembly protein PilE